MPLVDLQTNLKSLRYGKDRKSGGSSNQPYIQTSIPSGESGVGSTGGPDFLLRGGLLTPGRILKDTSRLTQMFFDFKSPNGLLFTAKQNVLSRTAVATNGDGEALNEGAYLPTSTILQAAGNPIGLHLNKQGIDPFKGIGKNKGGIFELFGGSDPLGNPTYSEITTNPNYKSRLRKWVDGANSKLFQTRNKGTLLYEYQGGPGSALGIGKTQIFKVSETNLKKNEEYIASNNTSFSYLELKNQISSKYSPKILKDYRDTTSRITKKANSSVDYANSLNNPSTKILENRVNLGNPGSKGLKNRKYDYDPNSENPNSDERALDKITSYPLYEASIGGLSVSPSLNDLVKFRIGIINNETPDKKTYIHFRAFIDNMEDSYNAEWNSQKFMGRGEKFYKYDGFDRKISLGWTIAAQSKGELIPMYQKLNYLASTLAPDYSSKGYMGGNLATLTVGGYLYEQPGIITNINYSIPQESPWEISIKTDGRLDSSVKELPHMIKVTGFNFIPIHNFTPRLQQNDYEGDKGKISKYGDERYISLATSGEDKAKNNYDSSNFIN